MVLSGLSFYKLCDWSYDPRYIINFKYHKLKDGDFVFLNLDYFNNFLEDILKGDRKKRFNLICHNSDLSFTNDHYEKIKSYVYRIYAINNNCDDVNVITIPIGFQDYPSNHFKLIIESMLKSKNTEKNNLLYMNFSVDTNLIKRRECFEKFKHYDWVLIRSKISKDQFMKDVLNSKYILSPEGAGIDCHRIYEALSCGSIPIVKKSNSIMDEFYKKLPIKLVNEWDEITKLELEEDFEADKNKLNLWLEKNSGWINPRFWIQNIHFISFGCEKYELTKQRLRQEAEKSNFFSTINIFGPKDFDTDFKHQEFVKNNPRGYGYWIWKLYFVIKKLQQIKDNDVLVYADAGCAVNINGKKRLNEYLLMLNDKNDNDILCFQMNHLEYKYTKNDIFEYFNIEDTHKNSGQLVGGVLFIRKTSRIIHFFEKLYEINSNNYNFIDDSSSKTKNHPDFIDCRHDQSTFSVMIKQFYKNKVIIPEETWPPNDNWNFVCHVPILAKRLRF